MGVFMGVGDGVEVLAQLLGGGLVRWGALPTWRQTVALGSGWAVAEATSSNALVSCAAKLTWMADTKGFRSVKASRKALRAARAQLLTRVGRCGGEA